ncbi:LysR substrate-binding domain-containing protein [Pseudohalocynthiibacter aestuariivivens]|uniref:LysR substrate-binding domain-containing protein n=1 Tax=Pseudohalocynthiibacter aestuariivivens TaxID=1591409 RepID=A0ABV5JGG5_9RHOB|nr:LysR substrate-binding domain-containing protein [Pseudohalocynthiibacter aestuariivivens]MBS9718793.1 LysR family transcriptional regulator [Pseudohalocynthiibacter aestuariivivens]
MSRWLPSLNALRAFEATARLGSYKKAADELAVTPAAVKQLVGKLEDVFGEPLMSFEGRKMELTRIGAQAHDDLSSAFRQIVFAVQRIRNACENDRLIVSVEPSIASAWLVPRLQNFREQHPEIEILVDSSLTIVDLTDGVVSVAVRFGVQDHGDFIAHRLFDEHLSALCSPSLAAGPPQITEFADLQDAALLRWDLSACPWATTTIKWNFWHTWLEAVGARDVQPGKGINYTDYNQAVQAAIAGQGFILGSKPVLESYVTNGLLIDPFGVSAHPGIGYDVVTTRQSLDRPKVRKFIDWMLQEAHS